MTELIATGARVVDLSGDFRLRDAATYKKYYGADHPVPERLTDGTFVYGLPELNREAIKKAKYVASPEAVSRRTIEPRPPAARESRAAPRRGRDRRDHGLVRERNRPERGDAPPRAGGEPAHVQAARSPAHPRDRPDAERRGGEGRRDPVRAGERAALARNLRDELRPRRREGDRRAAQGTLRRDVRKGSVHARPGQAPAGGRRGARDELLRSRHPGRRREGRQARRRVLQRDGQPHRREGAGAGDPVDEHHARVRRAGVAGGRTGATP